MQIKKLSMYKETYMIINIFIQSESDHAYKMYSDFTQFDRRTKPTSIPSFHPQQIWENQSA